MKVAIIGGTGYMGAYLVEALLARGHHPVLLVRPGSEEKVRQADRCTLVPGDVRNGDTVRWALEESMAVIYNVGILREFPQRNITFEALQYEGARHAMDVAGDLGIERFLLTSANGVKNNGTAYQRTKYLAERHLLASGLAGTVFRPSVMFGPPSEGNSEFASRLRDEMIRPMAPAPLFYEGLAPFNAGAFPLAPVHVGNVAEIYVKALEDSTTVGQVYPLCGPNALKWREIIKTIAKAMGRVKWTLPTPVALMKTAAALFEQYEFFPITCDQLTMLMEGNICDASAVFEKFAVTPTPFDPESLAYLTEPD